MKYLKAFTILNISLSSLVIFAAYINGLGCQYTMKYWLPDLPFEIYSTCNGGQLNVGVSTYSPTHNTILEINGTLLSLGEHQFLIVRDIDKLALNLVDQYPFKATIQNSFILSSRVKRLNPNWVGIFSDSPLNIAFLSRIEGPLNLYERLHRLPEQQQESLN